MIQLEYTFIPQIFILQQIFIYNAATHLPTAENSFPVKF